MQPPGQTLGSCGYTGAAADLAASVAGRYLQPWLGHQGRMSPVATCEHDHGAMSSHVKVL